MGLPQLGSKHTRAIPGWAMAAGIAVLFVGVVGFAKATGHWQSAIPNVAYQLLVPNADEAAHPITDRQELLEQATVANRECALRRP